MCRQPSAVSPDASGCPYRRRPPGWAARAISYRHEHAIAQEAVAMAVVVQVMVELYPRVESKEGRRQ